MTSARKSPNMMSTTGRTPVIAAPTARPVNPASEIGVSMMRCVPNSSTSPFTTLKGVPASATSSPSSTMRESRRISSASASRMASPNPISRTLVAVSGIDVLVDLSRIRIGGIDRELDGRVHFSGDLGLDLVECGAIRYSLRNEPRGVQGNWISLRDPALLFLLRPVVFARNVSDVMAAVTVGVEQQEPRTFSAARAIHQLRRGRMNGAHVLAIHCFRIEAKRKGPRDDVARRHFREVRVLVVHVVLARVDDGQLPQRGEIHFFVQDTLAERAFAEEGDRDLPGPEIFRRERRAGRDRGAAADNRIRAEIAGGGIGNVHRPALALAVAGFLTEEFRKHQAGLGALGEAMPVAAMRARDVVVPAQCLADTDCHRFLTDVQVCEAGHQGAGIQVVRAFLEQPYRHHLAIHAYELFGLDAGG